MAISGYPLLAVHTAAMAGAWIAFSKIQLAVLDNDGAMSNSDKYRIWISGLVTASVTYGIAMPLFLIAYQKSLRLLGRRPIDLASIFGWITYGLTGTSLAVAFASEIALFPAMFFYLVSVTIGIGIGVRALGNAKEAERFIIGSTHSLLPYIVPVRGGAAVGIMGVF